MNISEPKKHVVMPLGLIGMLLLVLVIETRIGGFADELRPLVAWNCFFARKSAEGAATKAEILCLGDSLMKLGVLPAVLEEKLGRKAYNLGIISAEPNLTYLLLRRTLDHGGHPKAILVDFAPNLAKTDPRLLVDEKCEAMSLGDLGDLAFQSKDFLYLARLSLVKAFPSIRYRNSIRDRVSESLRESDDPATRRLRHRLPGLQLLHHWSVNLGSNVLSNAGVLEPGRDLAYLDPPWRVHELNWIYMDRLFALAESRQIPVYWLVPTFADLTLRRREFLGVDAAFTQFIARMQARHPGLHVLDARNLGLSPSMFSDPAHLNLAGATVQSLALADALADQLSDPDHAPRWVRLSAPKTTRIAARIEDYDTSRRRIDAQFPAAVRR